MAARSTTATLLNAEVIDAQICRSRVPVRPEAWNKTERLGETGLRLALEVLLPVH